MTTALTATLATTDGVLAWNPRESVWVWSNPLYWRAFGPSPARDFGADALLLAPRDTPLPVLLEWVRLHGTTGAAVLEDRHALFPDAPSWRVGPAS